MSVSERVLIKLVTDETVTHRRIIPFIFNATGQSLDDTALCTTTSFLFNPKIFALVRGHFVVKKFPRGTSLKKG